jgi:hypothetical protein
MHKNNGNEKSIFSNSKMGKKTTRVNSALLIKTQENTLFSRNEQKKPLCKKMGGKKCRQQAYS